MRNEKILLALLGFSFAAFIYGCEGSSSAVGPVTSQSCPPGKTAVGNGCVDLSIACAEGQTRDTNGVCQGTAASPKTCPSGQILNPSNICVPSAQGSTSTPAPTCAAGTQLVGNSCEALPPNCTPPQIAQNGTCVNPPSSHSSGGSGSGGSNYFGQITCPSGEIALGNHCISLLPACLQNGTCLSGASQNNCPPGEIRIGNNCISTFELGIGSGSTAIHFQDHSLEAAIRRLVHIPDYVDLTERDLERITSLVIDDSSTLKLVHSLAGIEHCKNLESLVLVGQQVEDITPLSQLTHLKNLDLSYNYIEDASPLKNLHLEKINLQENNIR